jgi:asparagine synthase (glutamine-hydrolysing)
VTPSGFPLLTDSEERARLLGYAFNGVDDWEHDLFCWLDAASDGLQRATCADLATWLPDDLLVKYDRMTMANSLEGRAPYLDPKVVEVGVRSLPPGERMVRVVGKVALRRIARRWIPDSILVRPKQGFVLPMRMWIKQWFERHGGVSSYFTSRPLPATDSTQVGYLVAADLQQGIRRERMLFTLIMLSEWYASFRQTMSMLHYRYEPLHRSECTRLNRKLEK